MAHHSNGYNYVFLSTVPLISYLITGMEIVIFNQRGKNVHAIMLLYFNA